MGDQATKVAAAPGTPTRERVLSVDIARGIALFSMLAANIYDVLDTNGNPTVAGMTVVGRSATMFAMVAGISVAFITGGRNPVQGDARRATRVGLGVRALMIGSIGLALGYGSGDLDVILPYYGLYFLLAIPLIGLRPRTLVCIAGGLVVVGPLMILGAASRGWEPLSGNSLTFTDLVTHPLDFVVELFVTGSYPAVIYMIYICAGLAIGRLDLSSSRVAARLLGGGLLLAAVAWFTSSALLFNFGGLQHLIAVDGADGPPATVRNEIIWDADTMPSWWWLAVRSHHSGTPFDALQTLGVAVAVLGVLLLVSKIRVVRRVLWPVAVAGSMTLTIYSAHALVLGSGVLDDNDSALYALTVAGALVFAVVWRRLVGQGPLERIVSATAGRARRAAMTRQLAGRASRK
jgi:uncharacterized membrane protein YeiB